MEAVPRLPMISFNLKTSTENAQFGPQLKQYIASFYNEDPESYNTEINNLESLRGAAVRPTIDVPGCQLLKKYYCQLHFLKSRFPMAELQTAAVYFSWKDPYTNMPCGVPDIRYELMSVLYNIGALHSQLGALDGRTSLDGMKMACTHFQCAAWAFQTVKENYFQMVPYSSSIEVVHFMQQVCLAQAQECILEKSMMDNRKATIIAKVAVQVVEFYKRALDLIRSNEESSFNDLVGSRTCKEWLKYLSFKVSYHKCIALLFQGQQAEEQQKMGERVAFYQAASEQLEEAQKLAAALSGTEIIKLATKDVADALGFTADVVEGKRKAAKNENEFIYHEEVPERRALQEVKGASLVKGIPFSVNDVEVSGPDIFARLVPMEAHEASSLYSEKKAQMIRQLGELVEGKDQALAEFMSSLQLEVFNQMRQATGLPQELIDRAAALSAKPNAAQDLITSMGRLSNSYHEVESMLNEIQELLKEEEESEKDYQDVMGKRAPSIISTDLAREAAKYREAHSKANDSNQNLHKAMTTHVANLKILSQPLLELQKQIPAVELNNNSKIDNNCVKEIEGLITKVEEMRTQRAMLWNQFREAVHKDDITSVLVTKQPDQALDQVFQKELQKHQEFASLIEQNAVAQENILKAFVDAYARSTATRRYLQDIISRRTNTVNALITSFDTYEDLLAKANKGIEFYNKLENNVAKLLQRIRSASKVQQEEREQFLQKSSAHREEISIPSATPAAPKLKDYLDSRKKMTSIRPHEGSTQYYPQNLPPEHWPPAVRPSPLGSEVNHEMPKAKEVDKYAYPGNPQQYVTHYPENFSVDQNLADRFSTLHASSPKADQYYQQYTSYSPNYQTVVPAVIQANQAATTTTDMYQPISSYSQNPLITEAANYQYPSGYSYPPTTDYTVASNQNANSSQPNIYYPSGYGPQQVSQVSAPNQKHPTDNSVNQEYATSVRPDILSNYNHNSTYSAPIPDMKSSNSSSNYSISSQSYPENFNNPQQYYQTYYGTNYPQPNERYTNNPVPQPQSQAYAYGKSEQPPVEQQSTTYSYAPGGEQPPVQQPGQMYSTGYVYPNAAPVPQNHNPVTTSYSHNTQPQSQAYAYGKSEQPPVEQQNTTYSYAPAGEQPPVQQPGQMYSSGYVYPNAAPTPHNQSYYSYPSGYAYPNAAQPASTPLQQEVAPTPVTSKSSNVDLLTGLDFSVSQAPLIPQQKTSETKITEPAEVKKAVSKPANEEKPTKVEAVIHRKPLNNAEVKKLVFSEIDKFEKFVEVLSNKTLSGPTSLDLKWKEIVDKQQVEKKAVSVARCYPMKNRYPDILPYDHSRVELKDAKDDYINASYVKDISYFGAPFIVTQAPLVQTIGDFWTMVREQNVELIACLLGDGETNNEIYWPAEQGRSLNVAGMVISLMSTTVKPYWTERLITIAIPEKRDSRVVMHLQLTTWPGSLFPTTADSFISYIKELVGLFLQQRNTWHPIVVHCASGIGRSGLTCLLITAILEMTNNATVVPDLVSLAVKLSAWRKNILRDREHLKFAYEALLCYMKQLIIQGYTKKALNEVGKEEEKINPSALVETKEASDPLSSLDPFWASKKNNS